MVWSFETDSLLKGLDFHRGFLLWHAPWSWAEMWSLDLQAHGASSPVVLRLARPPEALTQVALTKQEILETACCPGPTAVLMTRIVI